MRRHNFPLTRPNSRPLTACGVAVLTFGLAMVLAGTDFGRQPARAWANAPVDIIPASLGFTAAAFENHDCQADFGGGPLAGQDVWVFKLPGDHAVTGDFTGVTATFTTPDGGETTTAIPADGGGIVLKANTSKAWVALPAGWTLTGASAEITGTATAFVLARTCPAEGTGGPAPVEPGPSPSAEPSAGPSAAAPAPSADPSDGPSVAPSADPSDGPSVAPSAGPSDDPSVAPSDDPSDDPSAEPSAEPSASAAGSPVSVRETAKVFPAPSGSASPAPSAAPIVDPSEEPITDPSAGPVPSAEPSVDPSADPGVDPFAPIVDPSAAPSADPSAAPITDPSAGPVVDPSAGPVEPVVDPSAAPVEPVVDPSAAPTPSWEPIVAPSAEPEPIVTASPEPPVAPGDRPHVAADRPHVAARPAASGWQTAAVLGDLWDRITGALRW